MMPDTQTQLYEFKCSECGGVVLAQYDIAGDRHSDEVAMKQRDCTGNGTMEYLKPHAPDAIIDQVADQQLDEVLDAQHEQCITCDGTGLVDSHNCSVCKGAGYFVTKAPQQVDDDFDAGVCSHNTPKTLRCEQCVAEGVYAYAQPEFSVEETEVVGGIALSIKCTSCGLPISKTSEDFGMDCENDCARKAFEVQYGSPTEFYGEHESAQTDPDLGILSDEFSAEMQKQPEDRAPETFGNLLNTALEYGSSQEQAEDFDEVSPHTDGQPVAVAEPQGSVNVAPEPENLSSSLLTAENGTVEPTNEPDSATSESEPTLNDILPDFDSLAAGENVAKETVVLELHVRRPSFRRAFDSRAILGDQSVTTKGCSACKASGVIESLENNVIEMCDVCSGTGKVSKDKVDDDYIHVSKDIIDRNEIKNINKRIGVLKSYMHTRCVPSSILAAGLYLLPIKFIQEMDTAISSAQSDVDTLLNEFGPRYPEMIEAAKLKLGPHFNSNDYPPFNVLRAQWRIDAQYRSLNVPAVLQKVSRELFKREAAKCKAQWADTAQEVRDALRVGFTRLVSEFSDKLGNDPETGKPRVFQKGRLEKLRDFLITFEVRDLTGDAELASLASQARQLMEGADPQQLRKDGALRSTLEEGFKKIAEEAGKMVVVRERILADEDEL
jgi:hypothetical protein